MSGLLLFLAQIILLYTIWKTASIGSRYNFESYFNPACFFIIFYILFFVIEQIIYPLNGYLLAGYSDFSITNLEEIYTSTQIYLCVMLFFVLAGYFVASLNVRNTRDVTSAFVKNENAVELMLLYAFFVAGIAANVYLGVKFMSIEGFRSELVKTTDGKLATAIAFFGNYAYPCLMFRFTRHKAWLKALVITIIFGAAILFTGSRGRLLWPLVIFIALQISILPKLPKLRIFTALVFLVVILSIMDPLKKALTDTTGAEVSLSLSESLAALVEKRNFDGFANFSLVANSGWIAPDFSILYRGSRDTFMNTFYPEVYYRGVAFGSTYPSYFWMIGGIVGLCVMSAIFGASLAILSRIVRKISNRWLLVSYLFGIVWYAAVGGDFVESFAKMATAMLPGFVILAVNKAIPKRKKRNRKRTAGDLSASEKELGRPAVVAYATVYDKQ